MNLPEQAKAVGDIASLSTIGATFLSIIPNVAALLGLFWLVLRIYENETFKRICRLERTERTRAEDK
jgi:ABC-type Na+ efflux pump permease subunit